MRQFEVGDRVRIMDNPPANHRSYWDVASKYYSGKETVVQEKFQWGPNGPYYTLEIDNRCMIWRASELILLGRNETRSKADVAEPSKVAEKSCVNGSARRRTAAELSQSLNMLFDSLMEEIRR